MPSSKKIPKEKVIQNWGLRTTPTCTRNCGHTKEDTQNIFQCKRGDGTREKLKNTLLRWIINNRAEPNLITDILHGISLWRKGNPPLSPPNLPKLVANTFNKKNTGWIQALTGILAHKWAETKNAYLQYLGAKSTGLRWLSSQITKLWDTAWDMWKYRYHKLHSINGAIKSAVLAHKNEIISYQFKYRIIGIPIRRNFIFKTTEITLLYRPIRQKICLLAAISSAWRCDE